jgi:hypothetical protein
MQSLAITSLSATMFECASSYTAATSNLMFDTTLSIPAADRGAGGTSSATLRSDTLAVPRRFKHCTKLASSEARRARLLNGECLVAFAQTTRHARGSSHPHYAVPYECAGSCKAGERENI